MKKHSVAESSGQSSKVVDNFLQVMSPKPSVASMKEQLKDLRKVVHLDNLTKTTNFTTWSNMFRSICSMQGIGKFFKRDYVNPVESKSKRDISEEDMLEMQLMFAARAFLYSKLDEDMKEIITAYDDEETPFPIWEALNNHFVGTTATEMTILRGEFYSLEQTDAMALTKYIENFTVLCRRLMSGGATIQDVEKRVVFMKGLHSRYDMYKEMLIEQSDLNFNDILSKLVSYHRRKFGSPDVVVGTDVVMVVDHGKGAQSRGGRGSRGRGARTFRGGRGRGRGSFTSKGDAVVCYRCQKEGHVARDCEENETRVCYKCDKRGHLARDCHRACFKCGSMEHHQSDCMYPAEEGEANLGEEEEDGQGYCFLIGDSNELAFDVRDTVNILSQDEKEEEENTLIMLAVQGSYVDSGASGHFVQESGQLLEYQVMKTDQSIGSANTNASLKVLGSGHLKGWGTARHLKGLRKSLLSPGQLFRERGYTTTLSDKVLIKNKQGKIVATGQLGENNLYQIQDPRFDEVGEANLVELSSLDRAHYRFGHLCLAGLKELHKQGHIQDVSETDLKRGLQQCAACLMGKMTRQNTSKVLAARKRSASKKGEIIHMDSSGKMSVASMGYQYWLLFIDDYTGKPFVYLMERKSDSLACFKRFINTEVKSRSLVTRLLVSDDALEFVSADFKNYCQEMGIERRITGRYHPAQNPYAERGMRTYGEMARTMLAHSGLGNEWWAPAVEYAVLTRARCPTRSRENLIPEEEWTGQRCNTDILRPFGCQCMVYVPDTLRTKWDMKAEAGVFIGIEKERACWRVYLPHKKLIVNSRDVVFYSDMPGDIMEAPGAAVIPHAPSKAQEEAKEVQRLLAANKRDDKAKLKLEKEEAAVEKRRIANRTRTTRAESTAAKQQAGARRVVSKGTRATGKGVAAPIEQGAAGVREESKGENTTAAPSESKPTGVPHENNIVPREDNTTAVSLSRNTQNVTEPVALRRSTRFKKPDTEESIQEDSVFLLAEEGFAFLTHRMLMARDIPTPVTLEEALAGEQGAEWKAAADLEMQQLMDNEVFKAVRKPRGAPVVKNKFVFKVKARQDGAVDKYKVRLTAKGFMQKKGVNYFDTYAPVTKLTSVRTMLAYAVHHGLPVDQADAVAAFQQPSLEEVVYMEVPLGYEHMFQEGHVLLLKKAIYGLKQASKAWRDKLAAYLKGNGFQQSVSDQCVYVHYDRSETVDYMMAVYVDDVIGIPHNSTIRDHVKKILCEGELNFDYKGELKWYLGMHITRNPESLSMSQELYVQTMLEEFNMVNCKPVATPMSELPDKKDCPLPGSPEEIGMRNKPFRQLVGSLLYLAIVTRADIAVAVGKLCRLVSNPGEQHWVQAKRVLRYLRGTSGMKLTYVRGEKTDLQAYVDASWADEDNNRKSTTGWCMYLGGNLISWRTIAQRSVARSSFEAELMALSDVASEIIWFRKLLYDLQIEQEGATQVHEDNQGVIDCVYGEGSYGNRTKHIDVRYFYTREQIVEGILRVTYIATEYQRADIMTKALQRVKFEYFRRLLGLQ
jgi:hypothetical protein